MNVDFVKSYMAAFRVDVANSDLYVPVINGGLPPEDALDSADEFLASFEGSTLTTAPLDLTSGFELFCYDFSRAFMIVKSLPENVTLRNSIGADCDEMDSHIITDSYEVRVAPAIMDSLQSGAPLISHRQFSSLEQNHPETSHVITGFYPCRDTELISVFENDRLILAQVYEYELAHTVIKALRTFFGLSENAHINLVKERMDAVIAAALPEDANPRPTSLRDSEGEEISSGVYRIVYPGMGGPFEQPSEVLMARAIFFLQEEPSSEFVAMDAVIRGALSSIIDDELGALQDFAAFMTRVYPDYERIVAERDAKAAERNEANRIKLGIKEST